MQLEILSFPDGENLRRSDVVNWYLKQVEDEIETEEELARKKFLVDKVLDRLINHVSNNYFYGWIVEQEEQKSSVPNIYNTGKGIFREGEFR